MATVKIYETDGECGDFTAVVLSCVKCSGGYELVLDRTAFFPEGGGQRSDSGTIDAQPVLDVRTNDERDTVRHIVPSEFLPGTRVRGCVDMVKRFSDMQNHTAEHILSGTVFSLYGMNNVGFHMGTDCITVDFDGALDASMLEAAEKRANDIIYSDVPVKISIYKSVGDVPVSYRSKKEITGADIRIVEIPGADICACCAPHVSSTGKIGLVKILGFQKYKGGTRVEMLAGSRAFHELSKRFDQVRCVSARLSSKPDDLEARFTQLMNELAALKTDNADIFAEYAALRAEQVLGRAQPDRSLAQQDRSLAQQDRSLAQAACCGVLLFECIENNGNFVRPCTAAEMRVLVNALKDKTSGVCAVFTPSACKAEVSGAANDAIGTYRFVIGSQSESLLAEAAAALRAQCSASCGGRGNLIQGSVAAPKEAIAEALSRFTGEVIPQSV